MNIGTTSQVVPSPASLYGNQGSRCPFLFSSLKPATKAEVSKKPPRQRSGGGGVGRVFMRRGGTGCESSRASRILSQAGEPSVLRSPARAHLWPKGAPKPTPFSSCFEGMPAFALPLVLLRLLVNLLAFRNSGFSLLRRVYTFGLDGPSRIHSDHLSRGGDLRKRSF